MVNAGAIVCTSLIKVNGDLLYFLCPPFHCVSFLCVFFVVFFFPVLGVTRFHQSLMLRSPYPVGTAELPYCADSMEVNLNTADR